MVLFCVIEKLRATPYCTKWLTSVEIEQQGTHGRCWHISNMYEGTRLLFEFMLKHRLEHRGPASLITIQLFSVMHMSSAAFSVCKCTEDRLHAEVNAHFRGVDGGYNHLLCNRRYIRRYLEHNSCDS